MVDIILIFAPKRSGHHAFVNSLLAGNTLPTVFINNAPNNPNWYPRQYISSKSSLRLQCNKAFSGTANIKTIPLESNKDIYEFEEVPSKLQLKDLLKMSDTAKLVFNFEDRLPRQESFLPLKESIERAFKGSQFNYVHFMRDPLNLIASRLARSIFSRLDDKTNKMINTPIFASDPAKAELSLHSTRCTLIEQLSFALNSKNEIKNLFAIDYASWLFDRKYRDSHEFNKILNICSLQTSTTSHGGGSSFIKGGHEENQLLTLTCIAIN